MESVLNFMPFLWKFFQLSELQSDNLSEKWSKKLKLLIFGIFFASFSISCFFMFAEFLLIKSLTVEHVSVLAVVLTNVIRYLINYTLVFVNVTKIRKIVMKLPQNYSNEDDKNFKIIQRIKRSRIFVVAGLVLTLLFQILIITGSGMSIYTDRIIKVNYPAIHGSEFTTNLFNFWIILNIDLTSAFAVLNETLIWGSVVILTVELERIKMSILEFDQKLRKIPEKSEKFFQNFGPTTLQILQNLIHQATIQQQSQLVPEITKIIDNHSKNLEIFDQFEEIYSPILLVNFICGLVALSVEEFTTIIAEDMEVIMPVLITCILQTLSFFMQCYYCQQLKNASFSISDAIYDCKWEEIEDVKVKKHLLMILIRSQKSKTLTCWKFAENSFELFGSVRFFWDFLTIFLNDFFAVLGIELFIFYHLSTILSRIPVEILNTVAQSDILFGILNVLVSK